MINSAKRLKGYNFNVISRCGGFWTTVGRKKYGYYEKKGLEETDIFSIPSQLKLFQKEKKYCKQTVMKIYFDSQAFMHQKCIES